MSFIRSSAKIVENKITHFNIDIENDKFMLKKIRNLFKNEFEESLPDILLIKGVQFIDNIKNGVLLVLENTYTDQCLTNNKLKGLLENGLNEIKGVYKNCYTLLNNSWEEYEISTKKRIGNNKFETLINFRKHCFGSEDFASHNCHHKQNRFIIIKDKNEEKKFVICQACKKVYNTSFIKCRCIKCNVDFYTNLLKDDEDSTLLPATWENYHCQQILKEQMRCIKCQELFFINMNTGMLCCLNKKCNFTSKPMHILWSCSVCEKEFTSKAIPYNPLEVTLIKKVVRHTLLFKQRAHPNVMPCCDINVYLTDFYHKKICRGILFEGELKDKMIIVCEKCHSINFHERFIWTCPKCGRKFRDKINVLTDEQFGKNENKGIMPDIQKKYIEKEENEEVWDKVKKKSLKAVIDSPKKKNYHNFKGVYQMLMKRKENFEEDVLANFRMKALQKGNNMPPDKYEGNDIYEDKIDKKKNDNISNNNKEIIIKTPQKNLYKSPKKNPKQNPINIQQNKSPNRSPKISPYRSPKRSPYKSPKKSPYKSPLKSPKKIVVKMEDNDNDNNKGVKSEDDVTIDNNDDSDIELEFEANDEENTNNNNNVKDKKNMKQSIRRSIKDKTKGKEINEKDKEKKEEKEEKEENAIPNYLANNHLGGISDNLLNHINKRMEKILSKIKIPLINIDDYSLNRRIGEGSYGVIYSVTSNIDNKKYAIKKILARSLNEIDNFTKEFELVFSCNHPNIMKIYGISIRILDCTTYCLYVLMEMAKIDWDKEIKRRLKKRQKYTENELVNIIRELTDALFFMQKELKISHRDIKPQNILVFENGVYKLADFGEAKEVKISKQLNTLRGTELYMSPALYEGLKQGKNDVSHDPFKSDVFSLGFCLLYAASLNFELLYEARDNDNSEMIKKILNKSFIKKVYSDNLIKIIVNMLMYDEKNRFSFEELLNFIDEHYGKK